MWLVRSEIALSHQIVGCKSTAQGGARCLEPQIDRPVQREVGDPVSRFSLGDVIDPQGHVPACLDDVNPSARCIDALQQGVSYGAVLGDVPIAGLKGSWLKASGVDEDREHALRSAWCKRIEGSIVNRNILLESEPHGVRVLPEEHCSRLEGEPVDLPLGHA